MSDILTITFNPCIDKSTSVSALAPEKKLRCSKAKFEPGGGGINVARAIKKLGGEATAVYPAGGYSGKFLKVLLDEENVKSLVVETAQHTRENMIVLDVSSNLQYRFGMPGQELSQEEWQKCLQLVEETDSEFIVASGSLPPGVPADIFITLGSIARRKKSKLIVDSSGDALQHAFHEHVYLIKPNLGELSKLAGEEELDVYDIGKAARKLIKETGCNIIVVSMGASGAMMITKDEIYKVATPPVKRKSTVGAGDSMVAGIVLSLSSGKSLREAITYGVASGTAAIINPGTGLCNLNDVNRIYDHIISLNRVDTEIF
ncbi:MAG: 1-phosphofructokinase family hexose kinase [Ginsengibacter sp.]